MYIIDHRFRSVLRESIIRGSHIILSHLASTRLSFRPNAWELATAITVRVETSNTNISSFHRIPSWISSILVLLYSVWYVRVPKAYKRGLVWVFGGRWPCTAIARLSVTENNLPYQKLQYVISELLAN